MGAGTNMANNKDWMLIESCLQMPIIHYNLLRGVHSICHLAKKQSMLFKSVLDEVEKGVTIEEEAELGILE